MLLTIENDNGREEVYNVEEIVRERVDSQGRVILKIITPAKIGYMIRADQILRIEQ